MTTDQIRELSKSLERALDILHDVNTKLYVADDAALSAVDKNIEKALMAGHAAHQQMSAIIATVVS